MPRVLSKVLGPINHKSLAPEEVDSQRNALIVDFFLGTLAEVLALLEALGVDDAVLEHLAVLLTQFGVLLGVGFEEGFPDGFDAHLIINGKTQGLC